MKVFHVQLVGMAMFIAAAVALLFRGVEDGWGWFIFGALLCIPGCMA